MQRLPSRYDAAALGQHRSDQGVGLLVVGIPRHRFHAGVAPPARRRCRARRRCHADVGTACARPPAVAPADAVAPKPATTAARAGIAVCARAATTASETGWARAGANARARAAAAGACSRSRWRAVLCGRRSAAPCVPQRAAAPATAGSWWLAAAAPWAPRRAAAPTTAGIRWRPRAFASASAFRAGAARGVASARAFQRLCGARVRHNQDPRRHLAGVGRRGGCGSKRAAGPASARDSHSRALAATGSRWRR